MKTQGIGGKELPVIEDSKKARRAYSIFLTEVAALKDLRDSLGVDDIQVTTAKRRMRILRNKQFLTKQCCLLSTGTR